MMPPIDPTSKDGKLLRAGFVAGFHTARSRGGRAEVAFDEWLVDENARRTATHRNVVTS